MSTKNNNTPPKGGNPDLRPIKEISNGTVWFVNGEFESLERFKKSIDAGAQQRPVRQYNAQSPSYIKNDDEYYRNMSKFLEKVDPRAYDVSLLAAPKYGKAWAETAPAQTVATTPNPGDAPAPAGGKQVKSIGSAGVVFTDGTSEPIKEYNARRKAERAAAKAPAAAAPAKEAVQQMTASGGATLIGKATEMTQAEYDAMEANVTEVIDPMKPLTPALTVAPAPAVASASSAWTAVNNAPGPTENQSDPPRGFKAVKSIGGGKVNFQDGTSEKLADFEARLNQHEINIGTAAVMDDAEQHRVANYANLIESGRLSAEPVEVATLPQISATGEYVVPPAAPAPGPPGPGRPPAVSTLPPPPKTTSTVQTLPTTPRNETVATATQSPVKMDTQVEIPPQDLNPPTPVSKPPVSLNRPAQAPPTNWTQALNPTAAFTPAVDNRPTPSPGDPAKGKGAVNAAMNAAGVAPSNTDWTKALNPVGQFALNAAPTETVPLRPMSEVQVDPIVKAPLSGAKDGLAKYMEPGGTDKLNEAVKPTNVGKPRKDWNIDIDPEMAIGLGLDAGRAILSAIGANQELPTFEEDPALRAERERLGVQSRQGMTASEMGRLDTTIRQQSAARSETTRMALGGGATQAAVIAGQSVNAGTDTQAAFAVQDMNEQRKREAQPAYMQALNRKQNLDYANYQQDYNGVLNSRNVFTQAMDANLQQFSDRMAYGKLQPYVQKQLGALQAMQQTANSTGINPSSILNLALNPRR